MFICSKFNYIFKTSKTEDYIQKSAEIHLSISFARLFHPRAPRYQLFGLDFF